MGILSASDITLLRNEIFINRKECLGCVREFIMMFDYVIILWLHVCRLPSSFVSPTMYFAKCLLNSIISISIYLSSDCRHTLNNDYAGLFSIHGSIWVCMIECLQDIFQRVVLLTVKNTLENIRVHSLFSCRLHYLHFPDDFSD